MKSILVAVTLALSLSASAHAQTAGSAPEPAALRPLYIDDAQIARLKRLLQLTAAQERNWPPVEAALRDFARRSPRLAATTQAAAMARTDVQQLLAAALPLIRMLDADQRRNALAFVRSMGLLAAVGPI